MIETNQSNKQNSTLEGGATELIANLGVEATGAGGEALYEGIVGQTTKDQAAAFETGGAVEAGNFSSGGQVNESDVGQWVDELVGQTGEVLSSAGEIIGEAATGAGEVIGKVVEGTGEVVGEIIGGILSGI